MLIDVDRHVAVSRYQDLFPHMTLSWQKHFEREEWIGSAAVASDHVRVSDRLRHDPEPSPSSPPDGSVQLLLPHQGLTVNGWADHVAARSFLAALNGYAQATWSSPTSRPVVVLSPFDVEWSVEEIARHDDADIPAVALPLAGPMLGSDRWSPIFATCQERDIPVVVHFSGVEGRYLGAPPLSGGAHASAYSRLTLMPHLAESTIASLAFEGAFARFPRLQILVTGFGFTWLPSLLWRLDREWRTFRHDVPWVTTPPSDAVLTSLWFSTWPVAEAADPRQWEDTFTDRLRGRVLYGSHAPHGGDGVADILRVLGADWPARLELNSQAALPRLHTVVA
ncbi:amidohydrolase family protein [Pseudonocardia xishanensis]|uniref:Amidohydrolase-related domain-containing protein n=1 Tax=Pseudonocardia xishanensis TaxID=630995 RepID=A0ABP8RUW8_9PSEU